LQREEREREEGTRKEGRKGEKAIGVAGEKQCSLIRMGTDAMGCHGVPPNSFV
jgi:hypothetical protein